MEIRLHDIGERRLNAAFPVPAGYASYPTLSTRILFQTEQYGQRTSGKVKAGNPALSYLGFKPGLDELSAGRKKEEMQNPTKKSLWGKTAFAAAALAGALLFMGASALRADESGCQRRLAKADHQLHEAGKHHGWESKQAEHARHELREAREWCWTHERKWWDEDNRHWHTDRDWDDHDHDRDRDH